MLDETLEYLENEKVKILFLLTQLSLKADTHVSQIPL